MYQCPTSLGGAISPTMSSSTLLNGISINGIYPNYCLLSLNNKIKIKSIFYYTDVKNMHLSYLIHGKRISNW